MITSQEALQIILSNTEDFGIEEIPFLEATGRVLKEDIKAGRDFPPFDNERMDGVAKSLDRSIDGTRKTNELLGFGPRLRETSEQMLQEIRSFESHHEENQKTYC